MVKLKPFITKKEGYVSIEAVIAMSFFLVVFFLTLGFFTYIQPHSTLQREVHTLATIAERQGGLTAEDIENFEIKLQSYRFIQDSSIPILITATTQPGDLDVSDVTPFGEEGEDYISRNSKEIITVTATLPSNSSMLKPLANFFGVETISDYYIISESVMSERY